MTYLLDTNVISELIKPKPNKNVIGLIRSIPDTSLYLSVLTLGEIRKGVEKIPASKKKEQLRIWLETQLPQQFIGRLISIDTGIAERWGKLVANVGRSLPAIDSLIAATVLHHDLTLMTRNVDDFSYLDAAVINPWET